ncbi:MAG: hypothetical protein JJE29_04425 [Peptostreptococcaceae bacterium]|nr:hypothetical protein [Peptostreptococcaceae bacterium]
MKIKSGVLGIIIFLAIFGGIAFSSSLGYWQTESSKEPAVYDSGEFEGMPNPGDIRGSYSFSDVSEAFGIPIEDLTMAFVLPEDTDPGEFKNKDLELIYENLKEEGTEIGNGSVKLFVALYLGLPYEIEEGTFLPLEAVAILKEKAEPTEEQIEYIERNGIEVRSYNAEESPALEMDDDAKTSGEETDERTINGKTTFADLLDWGITSESIGKILGTDIPEAGLSIKDFCTQKGLEFLPIKEELQREADALDQG